MAMILHVLIAMVAGWLQRHQQQIITYLQAENRILKAQLGGRRLRLTDTERRRLAALAYPLGRTRLEEVATMPPLNPPALVPPPDRAIVRWKPATSPMWPTPYRRGGGAADCMHGRRESIVGLSPHPRGVGEPGTSDRQNH